MLVQAIVQAVAPPAIPAAPLPGQCWIVGAGATGVWSGHDQAIACWTEGGWRFVPSQAGMRVWSLADGQEAQRTESQWVVGRLDATMLLIGGVQVVGARQPGIANVSGGGSPDVEVRAAVSAILRVLRAHGLIEV